MNASLFYISQLLGYRIFRWLFNFTFSRLFNFTKFWWYKVTYYPGFNPRPPRWGRRIRITRLRMRFNPRPTRGATNANNARAYTNVFQSTPPREGRRGWKATFDWLFEFQSTPPHEGRRCPRRSPLAASRFNPRPRAGGDLYVLGWSPSHCWFQSTPPREGRPLRVRLRTLRQSFNPRPHARGDQ